LPAYQISAYVTAKVRTASLLLAAQTGSPFANAARPAPVNDGDRAMAVEQRTSDRTRGYSLHLDLTEPQLTALGELDLAAVADIADALALVDGQSARLHVDLSGVTFCDTSALQPFVEAARRRAELGQSPIAIESTSAAVDRLLEILHLDGHPLLDVQAWDRIETPSPTQVLDLRGEQPV
jgi:anti-anti-sigma regulatory factor